MEYKSIRLLDSSGIGGRSCPPVCGGLFGGQSFLTSPTVCCPLSVTHMYRTPGKRKVNLSCHPKAFLELTPPPCCASRTKRNSTKPRQVRPHMIRIQCHGSVPSIWAESAWRAQVWQATQSSCKKQKNGLGPQMLAKPAPTLCTGRGLQAVGLSHGAANPSSQ